MQDGTTSTRTPGGLQLVALDLAPGRAPRVPDPWARVLSCALAAVQTAVALVAVGAVVACRAVAGRPGEGCVVTAVAVLVAGGALVAGVAALCARALVDFSGVRRWCVAAVVGFYGALACGTALTSVLGPPGAVVAVGVLCVVAGAAARRGRPRAAGVLVCLVPGCLCGVVLAWVLG